MKDDYYKILDVKFSASQEEIETNYRKLALKYQPDKNDDGSSDENMKFLNISHETLKNPERRKEYDLNNGINQTLEKATTVEQVSTLNKEKHDIYLEVLKELLPPIKNWNIFEWMKNMEKLEEKYKGLAVSFTSLNKILTPDGDLVKTLLEQLTPSNPTENINYAKIVVKKYQNIIDIYSELLKIPKVLTKLDTFIKYYNLDKEHLSLTTIEKVNYLVSLQENVSTNIVSFPNM